MSSGKKIATDSGIEIRQLYDQQVKMEERPGEYPFTRGVQPDMYRGKLWTMRQYAGFSTAEESNQRYHYLLSQGANPKAIDAQGATALAAAQTMGAVDTAAQLQKLV